MRLFAQTYWSYLPKLKKTSLKCVKKTDLQYIIYIIRKIKKLREFKIFGLVIIQLAAVWLMIFTFRITDLIYRIVASTNTCYYSENQVFGGVTTRDMSLNETCSYSKIQKIWIINSKNLDFKVSVSNMDGFLFLYFSNWIFSWEVERTRRKTTI